MSRRVRTLLAAGLLFVVLLILVLTLPVPYVALTPGPTYNTLGVDGDGHQIITLSGRASNPTSGHLNMTTIDESTASLTPVSAISGWLSSDTEVVPRSSIIPPGESQQQVNQQNANDFATSQDSATAAALCYLGYPQGFAVQQVLANSPSAGRLKVGDHFLSVDRQATTNQDTLRAVLAKDKPGQQVQVTVSRQGKQISVPITLGTPPKQAGSAQPPAGGYLGVETITGCLAPFQVSTSIADVGGPSAGLMLTLGIIDKVGTIDLTHGRFIAGTGTIDPSGQVGAIGGIQLKMIAARRAGAAVFLAPSGNCGDVRGAIPGGLEVIKVATLRDAITALQNVAANKSVPHC